MHHHIDSLAYTNRLRYLPPHHKLVFALFLVGLGYTGSVLIQILIGIWLGMWIVGYAGIPGRTYIQLHSIPVLFWLSSLPALSISMVGLENISSIYGDMWWGVSLGPVYVYLSKQGINQALHIFTRTHTLTGCMYFLLLTTPFVQINRLLLQLGCPRIITELLALMYRFIGLLADTSIELLTAQQARLGYSNWRSRWRSTGLLISQLLWRTLEEYRQIALGLRSRGFNGNLYFWYSERHRPNWRYLGEALGGYILLLTLTGWEYVNGL